MRRLVIRALICGAVQTRSKSSRFGSMHEQLTKHFPLAPPSTGRAVRAITTQQSSVSEERKLNRKIERSIFAMHSFIRQHSSPSELTPEQLDPRAIGH